MSTNGSHRPRAPLLPPEERKAIRDAHRRETDDLLRRMQHDDSHWEAKTNPVIVNIMPPVQPPPERSSQPDSDPPPTKPWVQFVREFRKLTEGLGPTGRVIVILALLGLLAYALRVAFDAGSSLDLF